MPNIKKTFVLFYLGKEKEAEYAAPKGQKLTDLDDEGVTNGNKVNCT